MRQGGYLLAGPLLYELVVVAATAQLAAALVRRDARYPGWLHRPAVVFALVALAALQVALFAGCFAHALGLLGTRARADPWAGRGAAGTMLFDRQLAPLGRPLEA